MCLFHKISFKRKYVKFDDTEQRWYSENYPDDPSLIESKGKGHKKENDNGENKKRTKKKSNQKRLPLTSTAETVGDHFMNPLS